MASILGWNWWQAFYDEVVTWTWPPTLSSTLALRDSTLGWGMAQAFLLISLHTACVIPKKERSGEEGARDLMTRSPPGAPTATTEWSCCCVMEPFMLLTVSSFWICGIYPWLNSLQDVQVLLGANLEPPGEPVEGHSLPIWGDDTQHHHASWVLCLVHGQKPIIPCIFCLVHRPHLLVREDLHCRPMVLQPGDELFSPVDPGSLACIGEKLT